MFKSNTHIVLFDTEYTAWEGSLARNWSGENEEKEIIQIGAVRVRTDVLDEIDAFSVFIKPVKNPHLSEYITTLTGISQDTLDAEGLTLEKGLTLFDDFSQGADLYSWGADGSVIMENCRLIKIQSPIHPSRFFDIRSVFSEKGIDAKDYMSSTISGAFQKENPNLSHNALNDARNILIALKSLASQ